LGLNEVCDIFVDMDGQQETHQKLGGGFKDFLFSPLPGKMIQFD